MRKIIIFSMLSLDGVMQAPGGPQEDTSGGFAYGGWVAPFSDEIGNEEVKKQLQDKADYLLGRTTFEIWENYWPHHADIWPGINEGTKYVLSTTRTTTGWQHTQFIDSIEAIRQLKNTSGADIHVWGSSSVVQLLLQHNLADELRLSIHPITLGKGKKLFNDALAPSSFTLTSHTITTTGVIMASYARAGEVKTGNAGEQL